MTDCGKIKSLLWAQIDGELEAATRSLLEAHLTGCQACSSEFTRLKRLSSLIREIPAEELDEDLTPSVMARLPKGFSLLRWVRQAGRSLHWRPVPAIAGATLLLVVAASLLLIREQNRGIRLTPKQIPTTKVVVSYLREHALYAGGQPLADQSSLLVRLVDYRPERPLSQGPTSFPKRETER